MAQTADSYLDNPAPVTAKTYMVVGSDRTVIWPEFLHCSRKSNYRVTGTSSFVLILEQTIAQH